MKAGAEQWQAPASCDQCPHPISEHVLWPPDEICGGWMHCAADACTSCWHDWPKLSSGMSTGESVSPTDAAGRAEMLRTAWASYRAEPFAFQDDDPVLPEGKAELAMLDAHIAGFVDRAAAGRLVPNEKQELMSATHELLRRIEPLPRNHPGRQQMERLAALAELALRE